MNIKEYSKIIGETAVFPKEVSNFGLAYGWLGLIDESDEFLNTSGRENEVKEFGDVCWYATLIALETALDIEAVFDIPQYNTLSSDIPNLEGYTGKIKKFYRDATALHKLTLTNVLRKHLANLLTSSRFLTPLDLPEILEKNYIKLIKRRETNTLHGSGDNRENE